MALAALTLRLTVDETAALKTLAAGIGELVDEQVPAEAALAAAVDLGLTRLIDDFDIANADVRSKVETARTALRRNWVRGGAIL